MSESVEDIVRGFVEHELSALDAFGDVDVSTKFEVFPLSYGKNRANGASNAVHAHLSAPSSPEASSHVDSTASSPAASVDVHSVTSTDRRSSKNKDRGYPPIPDSHDLPTPPLIPALDSAKSTESLGRVRSNSNNLMGKIRGLGLNVSKQRAVSANVTPPANSQSVQMRAQSQSSVTPHSGLRPVKSQARSFSAGSALRSLRIGSQKS